MTEFANGNRIKETSVTTGTGTYALAGAVAQYQPFSVRAGKLVAYVAQNASSWEVGQGLSSVSPATLSRLEIFASSNGGAPVNWAAPVTITCTEPADLSLSAANTAIDPPCRFEFSSATACVLKRYDGAEILLQAFGVWRQCPIASGGVIISNAGLAANTLHYAYAWRNAGVAALEFSVTVPADDADRGVRVKTGDSTRRLVGMARTDGSSQFVLSDNKIFVVSWPNLRPVPGKIVEAANAATASPTPVELSGGRKVEFITWGGQSVDAEVQARCQNSIAGSGCDLRIAFDGTLAPQGAVASHPTAAGDMFLSVRAKDKSLAEGYHSVTPFGARTGGSGTATFVASYNATLVEVQG